MVYRVLNVLAFVTPIMFVAMLPIIVSVVISLIVK